MTQTERRRILPFQPISGASGVRAMRLQELCDDIMHTVGGAQGCALIDLDTGLPLAMSAVAGAPAGGMMEFLAATGADFFCGETSERLRTALDGPEGPGSFVQEVQTTTDDSYYFMCSVPDRDQTVLMLITDRTANLGLGWAAMREMLERVRAAATAAAPNRVQTIPTSVRHRQRGRAR